MEKWSKSMDDGKEIDVIYTDFSKAFDVVSHRKLLHKIHKIGIGGYVGKWIENFLTDRFQRVRVEESVSNWTGVLSGVPQGSVLGPVLFLIFINDLPEAVPAQDIKLFADDAKLDKLIESDDDASMLQESLDKMIDWSNEWSLKMNINKCKVLHLSRSVDKQNQSYNMNSPKAKMNLEEVEYEKDLGVFVDSRLSFETHVLKAVSTANKMTGILKRNFKYMDDGIFLNLYKSLVRPHIEYSCVVWNPVTIRDQKAIEGVQRRATKSLPKLKDLNYEQRLRTLGLPSLQYRRLRADMIQVYKIIRGIDRIDMSIFFEIAKDSRTRGHKYKLCKRRGTTSFRMHTFSNRVIETWNSLPDSVVEAPDILSFKERLNTFWKTNPIKFSPTFC